MQKYTYTFLLMNEIDIKYNVQIDIYFISNIHKYYGLWQFKNFYINNITLNELRLNINTNAKNF